MPRMLRRLLLCATLLSAPLAACTPALDWREVRVEGGNATALFPCKPKSQSRQAALAGAPTRMTLLSCEAGGHTFALAHAELADPARVGPALAEMAAALGANLQAGPVRAEPVVVAGMTPNAQARRLWIDGTMPDGTPVEEHAALFARGTRVYQAAVLGPRPGAAAQTFLDSLRLGP
jgi:hypothetical protein